MDYLYFILPPIIIVVTVALILLLLSKKSLSSDGSGKKNIPEESQAKLLKVKKSGSSFLEKGIHLFKNFSLNLQGKLKNVLVSIKKKQKVVLHETKNSDFEDETDVVSEKKALDKGDDVQSEKETEPEKGGKISKISGGLGKIAFPRKIRGMKAKSSSFAKRPEKKEDQMEVVKDIEKKKDAPMVSDEVVYPEKTKKREENKELESVLVERVAKDPRDVDAYERLGDYYEQTENYKDALPCFEYVLKLNPGDKRAQIKISKMKKMIGA